jgi:D-arabinose 1-dehydrogenase-like Zn-dependent alcohol dehydrogenase
MKGVVFTGDRKLEIRDFPDPTPGPREVVLEIKASGMCGSDLHNYRAPPQVPGTVTGGIKREAGTIAGHEPCGIVAAVGSGVSEKEARVGQRVMDHHYDGCGGCKHCRGGWTQMCLEGATVYGVTGHGGHAPYMKVPVSTLIALPDELSFATGAAISCGTGTAWGALVRMNLTARDTIAVFGQGPVGLSTTQLASAMGARVIAIDISAERAVRASGFGAAHVIDSSKEDPPEVPSAPVVPPPPALGEPPPADTTAPSTNSPLSDPTPKRPRFGFVSVDGAETFIDEDLVITRAILASKADRALEELEFLNLEEQRVDLDSASDSE